MFPIFPLISIGATAILSLIILTKYFRAVKNVFIIIDDSGNVIYWRETKNDFVNVAGRTYTITDDFKPTFIKGNKRYYIFKHNELLPLQENQIKITPSYVYTIIKRLALSMTDIMTQLMYAVVLISIVTAGIAGVSAYFAYQNQQLINVLMNKLTHVVTTVNSTVVTP